MRRHHGRQVAMNAQPCELFLDRVGVWCNPAGQGAQLAWPGEETVDHPRRFSIIEKQGRDTCESDLYARIRAGDGQDHGGVRSDGGPAIALYQHESCSGHSKQQ
jgi:hypothetical protein